MRKLPIKAMSQFSFFEEEKSSRPRVLNKHKLKAGDEGVYIGRPTKWGNPFAITPTSSRDEVVKKFREYLQSNQTLIQAAKSELKGKNLICFCAPHACHGDVLMEFANS